MNKQEGRQRDGVGHIFAAGPYTAAATTPSQSAGAVGLLQDGWSVEWAILEQNLDKTDAYARNTIESFHQGLNVALAGIFHEWKALELRLLSPHANILPIGATNMDAGIPGTQGTDMASSIVLTALTGTPAAANGPATATFTAVKHMGDVPISRLFGPEKSIQGFRGRVYPYTRMGAKGGISYWAAT